LVATNIFSTHRYLVYALIIGDVPTKTADTLPTPDTTAGCSALLLKQLKIQNGTYSEMLFTPRR
jgi:hypothetical protein